MRLLLDTHVLLWILLEPERLPGPVQEAFRSGANTAAVSVASAWEIAIKVTSGRLGFPLDEWDMRMQEIGVSQLHITQAHAIAAGRLPRLHNDPFDRMLIAQALLEGLTLVTADRQIAAYDVPILAA